MSKDNKNNKDNTIDLEKIRREKLSSNRNKTNESFEVLATKLIKSLVNDVNKLNDDVSSLSKTVSEQQKSLNYLIEKIKN